MRFSGQGLGRSSSNNEMVFGLRGTASLGLSEKRVQCGVKLLEAAVPQKIENKPEKVFLKGTAHHVGCDGRLHISVSKIS